MPSLKALKEQGQALLDDRETLVKDARPWADKQAEYDDLTKNIDAVVAQVTDLKAIDGDPFAGKEAPAEKGSPTLGDHFVKSVGEDGFRNLKSRGGYTVDAPEFKAATDPQVTTGSVFQPYLTQFDPTVVRGFRRPLVSDLLGSGTLGANSNAVTYLVEGAVEGAFTTVAEGSQKPQIHIADPTTRTDALKKIAAWFDSTDEMAEDLAFWVSEINNRGTYLLSLFEEQQLVAGDGTGSNILGMLNRSGIQTETQAASGDSAQDAIFRALTKVQTGTGLTADGIIINPADYQALRLAKDGNNQYYGGGFFYGEYGVGQVASQPNLWGVPTIVSAAVPAKTVAVGAFKAATTVYRKGGVRVESTNSDLGKFTKNIITTRIEERVALAVRLPAAIVKTTLV